MIATVLIVATLTAPQARRAARGGRARCGPGDYRLGSTEAKVGGDRQRPRRAREAVISSSEVIRFVIVAALSVASHLVDLALTSRVSEVDRRSLSSDRDYRRLSVSISLSTMLAIVAAVFVTPLAWPGSHWAWLIAGAAVVCAGIGLRFWSIVTLGRFFRLVVEIQDGHRVVRSGPYRLVRHPSYTGLLLIQLGIGIAIANWLSVAICLTLPLFGLLPRIRYEERALGKSLGAEYSDYAATTKRLVPGVW